MSTLMDIINEEKNRLEKLLIFYDKEIQKLPKGFISRKKINGNIYYYRCYRKDNSVKTIYLGTEKSDNFNKIQEQISERRKLEHLKRKTKENLLEAKRALRAER